jgi:hypothetical protein
MFSRQTNCNAVFSLRRISCPPDMWHWMTFSSRSNKRHSHVSAPFLTSLLPYYSCFHSLFLCMADFPQNSKFSLRTFLYFYLLKFSYCYRHFFFFFGSLQLFISRDLRSFSDFTQGKMVNSYRRFGTTYRSRLSKSLTVYLSTLRNIPEERRSHLHRDGSPKSRVFISAVQNVFVSRLVTSVPFCLMPHTRLIPLFFYSILSI